MCFIKTSAGLQEQQQQEQQQQRRSREEVMFFFYEEGFSVTRKRGGQGAPIAVTSALVWPSCPHKEGIVVDGPSQTKSRLCFGGGGDFCSVC